MVAKLCVLICGDHKDLYHVVLAYCASSNLLHCSKCIYNLIAIRCLNYLCSPLQQGCRYSVYILNNCFHIREAMAA